MPDLTSTDIAINYRRQEVPYSRFGTRKVIWFNIGNVDTRTTDFTLDNALMNAMIDIIQTRAEIAIIGAPSLGDNYGRFIVGIFEDTFNNGDDTDPTGYYTNDKSTTLQTALEDALGDGYVDVEQIYIYGGPGAANTGWETSNNYREYDTKADYVADSYLNPNNL